MAWLAVHKNGEEGIFANKPSRGAKLEWWYDEVKVYDCDEGIIYDSEISLPKGTIKKLIGRDLDWDDEPVYLS